MPQTIRVNTGYVTNPRKSIPKQAVELFKLCREIETAGLTSSWEDDQPPGRRREYLTASAELQQLLRLKLWDWPVMSTKMPFPPDRERDWIKRKEYSKVHQLYWALEDLAELPPR